MSKNIRILSVVLAVFAFFFFSCGPLASSAQAAIVLDDAIIAIIIAALAACGITITANGGFNSIADYISDLFYEYCNDRGVTMAEALNGIQYGRNTTGKLLLNNRFVVLIDSFITFLKARLGLLDNAITVLQSEQMIEIVNSDGIPIYIPLQYASTDLIYPSTSYVNVFTFYHGFEINEVYHLQSGYYAQLLDDGSTLNLYVSLNSDMSNRINLSLVVNSSQHRYLSYTYENYYSTSTGSNRYYSGGEVPVFYNENDHDFEFIGYAIWYHGSKQTHLLGGTVSNSNFIQYFMPHTDTITAITGSITAPSDDSDYLPGDGAILDVGADWGITLPDILDDVIPGDLVDEGEIDASIEYEGEQDVTEQIIDAGQASISSDASDYAGPSLVTVFPFCIPFDIYDFFECLAADPVSPSFQWRFYVPGIADETITIDLSSFDTVAQIVRTMELLLFCVGLALVTRKLIRG